MRKLLVAVCAVVLVVTGCASGANTRTIFVDYSSDEFATTVISNFPKSVTVRQGDTLVVRQTWTGMPHTFTGGTKVTHVLETGEHWNAFLEAFESFRKDGVPLPNPEAPGNATVADFAHAVKDAKPSDNRSKLIEALRILRASDPKVPDLDHPTSEKFAQFAAYAQGASDKLLAGLAAGAITDDGSAITQNGGQPCYLDSGDPPQNDRTPCPKANQKQPKFNGRQTFYNSGIIRYEGPQGNTYRVPLSHDITPGTYYFFCTVHGPAQQTKVVVKAKGADIPTQDQVSREIRKEIEVVAEPLRKQFRDTTKTGKLTLTGADGKSTTVSGPFAGLFGEDRNGINEFVPKRLVAKVGQPITWKMIGGDHSISFDVPKYFPIIEFLKDGTVRLNSKLFRAAGGAKPFPGQHGDGPVSHDGGTWNGSGFWSSGLISADPYIEYTMRVGKPGTYRFACLIHPPMVGTVVVTS